MNDKTKKTIFRLFDICALPITLLSALHLKILRRYGVPNFPNSRKVLLNVGIFPIRRHFYEPLFHPDDLPQNFEAKRNLPGINFRDDEQIQTLCSFCYQSEIIKFSNPDTPVLENGQCFNINNVAFGPGDVDCYYSLIRKFKPKKIIEIGSGHSSIVAVAAIEKNTKEDPSYSCEFTSIEPYPWFRHPKLTAIDNKVENVDVNIFAELGENDILFVDSSHMIRPCGDVIYEILEILPRLNSGVFIHFHDIFTPYNYLPLWVKTFHSFWNEQYMLEAYLSETNQYRIFAALYYLSRNYRTEIEESFPLLNNPECNGQSLWLQKA